MRLPQILAELRTQSKAQQLSTLQKYQEEGFEADLNEINDLQTLEEFTNKLFQASRAFSKEQLWDSFTNLIQQKDHILERRQFNFKIAVRTGKNAEIIELIKLNQPVNFYTLDGSTPLLVAASLGHTATIEVLLANGAELNATDRGSRYRGCSALHFAAMGGHVEAVKLLLEKGAKDHPDTRTGYTALQFAVLNGHRQVVAELLDAAATHKDQVSSDKPSPQYSLLHLAVSKDDIEMAKLLLLRKVNVNAVAVAATAERIPEIYDQSPLQVAAQRGNKDMVALLLSSDADINHVNNLGQTALYIAAQFGKIAALDLLLRKGARLNLKDPKLVAVCGHFEICKTLLDRGFNPQQVDDDGRTAFDIAKRDQQTKIMALLKIYQAMNKLNANENTPLLNDDDGPLKALVTYLGRTTDQQTKLHQAIGNLAEDIAELSKDSNDNVSNHINTLVTAITSDSSATQKHSAISTFKNSVKSSLSKEAARSCSSVIASALKVVGSSFVSVIRFVIGRNSFFKADAVAETCDSAHELSKLQMLSN